LTNIRLNSLTYMIENEDLEQMVLRADEVPDEFKEFNIINEGMLDNEELAESGFPGDSEEYFKNYGRINGYMREFGSRELVNIKENEKFIMGCVVHLFDHERDVNKWMEEVFLKRFMDRTGELIGVNQKLISVTEVLSDEFYDHSLAVDLVQSSPSGDVLFTIVDFKIGRLLGVCFIGTKGTQSQIGLCEQLGLVFEQKIARVVLLK
jgi:hypothetical protein